jgi:hypothetical protein
MKSKSTIVKGVGPAYRRLVAIDKRWRRNAQNAAMFGCADRAVSF